MAREQVNAGFRRLSGNSEFLHLACRAIYLTSIARGSFVSLRDAVIAGLGHLARQAPFYVDACTRRYDRSRYKGDHLFYITFTPSEAQLVREMRRELRAIGRSNCSFFDVIVLALAESAELSCPPEGHPLDIGPSQKG